MHPPFPLVDFARYGLAMNLSLLEASRTLSETQLDLPLDIGMGSVRRILRHVLAGEVTWLERWRGVGEAGWIEAHLPNDLPTLSSRFQQTGHEQIQFIDSLSPDRLAIEQVYRDSKGSLFRATLGQMVLQGLLHSHHHRAQWVNALRRAGGPVVEVDYMYSVRKPV